MACPILAAMLIRRKTVRAEDEEGNSGVVVLCDLREAVGSGCKRQSWTRRRRPARA
jgi:hypothetical protein